MRYAELKDEIEKAPMTWLPALMVTVIRACVKRKVFRGKDALVRVATKAACEHDTVTQGTHPTEGYVTVCNQCGEEL